MNLQFWFIWILRQNVKIEVWIENFRLADTSKKQQQKLDVSNVDVSLIVKLREVGLGYLIYFTFKLRTLIKIFCLSFTIVRFTYPS